MFHWLTAFESGIKFKGKTLNSSSVGKYECSCFTSSQTRHQQFLKRINPSFTQNTLWMQRCGVVRFPLELCNLRGSPIGFSGSGIWLISRSEFGILKEKGDEIFGIVIMTGTRDMAILTSGSRQMPVVRNRDSGISKTEICKENQAVILLWSEIAEQWASRHPRFRRPYHTALWPLWWSVIYFREPWP